MKSFFSRLHDSTQTGHSKSTSKESYKFWTPAPDPEQAYAQPTNNPGDVATYATTRQHGEKRSSSRSKPPYAAPTPLYEKNATTNATAGPSSEKLPDSGSRPGPSLPSTHFSRAPAPATAKATSTRYRDYNDAKPHPPPPSATRPSYSTRTYAAHEVPAKTPRHGNARSESTPALAHEIWVPPIAPTSRQTEERFREPIRLQEATEALHRYHSHNEDNDAAMDTARREKDRDRPRDRDRDRERPRDRDRGRDVEAERQKHRTPTKDREVDPDRDRDRNRDKDRERERELARQRGKERERERDLAKDTERDRERKGREREREMQRELAERDRELQRQMELTKAADRDRREREREAQRLAEEHQRQAEFAKEADREKRERDREAHRQALREAEREKRERDREIQRQIELAAKEVERQREAQRQNELAKEAERERRERELQRQMAFARAAEHEKREREKEYQRQLELAKEERERRERDKEAQRQLEIATKEAAEREREYQRQMDLAREAERERRERDREAQRQMALAKEAEREKREAQRQAEIAKEAERERELQRQIARAKEAEREAQRHAEIAQEAERQKELQRQTALVQEAEREAQRQAAIAREAERERELQRLAAEKEAEHEKRERDREAQRQLETARETERQRQLDIAKQAELEKRESDREAQRQIEIGREAERQRQLDIAKQAEREKRERDREAQRQLELVQEADRERERREREWQRQRQNELAREERERERQVELINEAARERERKERELREREIVEEAAREKERRDREHAREEELQRERELANQIARLAQEADQAKERERERELAKEADKEQQRHRERERYRDKERERERRERERDRERDRHPPQERDQDRIRDIGEELERAEDNNAPPDQQQRDRHIAQRSRNETPTQDRDRESRRTRETRPGRDVPRPRDRQRDHGRYRAEATDGEQDIRGHKQTIPTDRERHKQGSSGWMSDNYTAQGRKTMRQVVHIAQVDDAEDSDTSTNRKPGYLVNHKRSIDEEPFSKIARSHRDKPTEGVRAPSYTTSNQLQSKALPDAPEYRLPISPMFDIHPPSKDNKLDDITTPPINNDAADIPVRREINRLKLHTRPDEPPPQMSTPIAARPTPLSRVQSSLQPLEQYSRINDPLLQHPPSRPAVAFNQPEPPQNAPSGSPGNLDHSTPRHLQASTPVAYSNSTLYQQLAPQQSTTLLQERLETPNVMLGGRAELPARTELPSTSATSNFYNKTPGDITAIGRQQIGNPLYEQSPVAHAPSHAYASINTRTQQENSHFSTINHNVPSPKAEYTETKPPVPLILPGNELLAQSRLPLNSQIPPTSFTEPQAPLRTNSDVNKQVHNPIVREPDAVVHVLLSEDVADTKHLSNQPRIRYNSNPQKPVGLGEHLQTSGARLYNGMAAEPLTKVMRATQIPLTETLNTDVSHPLPTISDPDPRNVPSNEYRAKAQGLSHLVHAPEHSEWSHYQSFKPTVDGLVQSQMPSIVLPDLQLRPSDSLPTHERVGTSISRPPTRTASRQDSPGFPSRFGPSASHDLASQTPLQPPPAVVNESPTSGLTRADLYKEVLRSNSNDRQQVEAKLNYKDESPKAIADNIKPPALSKPEVVVPPALHWSQSKQDSPKATQRNTATPIEPRSLLPETPRWKGVKQDSPRMRVDSNPHPPNPQTSRIPEESLLVQTTKSSSKQDSPLQPGLKHMYGTPRVPDNGLVAEQITKISSGNPFMGNNSPHATTVQPAAHAAPKQDYGNSVDNIHTLPSISNSIEAHQFPSTLGTMAVAADVPVARDSRTHQSQSDRVDDPSESQRFAIHPENPRSFSRDDQPSNSALRSDTRTKDREGPTERLEVDPPSLGFFTKSFSTALSKAVDDEKVASVPQAEPMTVYDRDRLASGLAPSQMESGARVRQVPAATKGYEAHPNILHGVRETPEVQRTHSRQPSTEQQPVRKESNDDRVELRSSKPKPPTPQPVDRGNNEEVHALHPHASRFQTPRIQNPVLADILSSPFAPKPAMATTEVFPPPLRPQEARQRTLSSSNMNMTPPELKSSRDVPSERPQRDTPQYISSQRYPSESTNKPFVGQLGDVPGAQDPRPPLSRPWLVQPEPQTDTARHGSSQRHLAEHPSRVARGQTREMQTIQETRTPLARPVAVPSTLIQKEKESPPVLSVETSRQTSTQRYTSEPPQRAPPDFARDGPTVQLSSFPSEARDSQYPPHTEYARQISISSHRYPAQASQRPVPDQIRIFSSAHDARPSTLKASNLQPTSSQAQARSGHYVPLVSDPPVQTSRMPSASNLVPENIASSRQTANRTGVIDSNPTQDRRLGDGTRNLPVSQGQGTSTTRTAPAENVGYRTYPQTSADSRFPNVPQVSASQAAAISVQQSSSSRHQHSASLPTSLQPSFFVSSANQVSREDLPRSSTPAPAQYKPTSHQINTGPHVSTTSLPKAPSEETILLTPSSLARSMALKPTTSRQSVASQASQSSRKGPAFFNMFKKTATSTQTPVQQYQIWHPTAPVKTPDASPKSMQPAPEPVQPASSRRSVPLPPPISIPVPIYDQRNPTSRVFTPFKYLTTKRNRAVSVASLEAQDGTATNTIVGSPTASMHSTAPIQPPPLRDPRVATEEWRNKEEAAAHALAKAKRRRQRPGVVFDVAEEHPDDVKRRPRRVKTKGRSSSKQTEPSQS